MQTANFIERMWVTINILRQFHFLISRERERVVMAPSKEEEKILIDVHRSVPVPWKIKSKEFSD